MRQAAFDGHGAAVTDERLLASEPLLDDGKQIIGQVGKTANGLMLDLAVLAKNSPEINRNVNLAVVSFFNFCDVDRAFVWLAHAGLVAAEFARPMKTQ